jgi:integrating conjugative element protein (TIGR03752 family)
MKGKNPIVMILLVVLALGALALFIFSSDDNEMATAGKGTEKETRTSTLVGKADGDDVPTEVKKLMADMQALQPLVGQVETMQKTIEVLKSENKVKDATIETLKQGISSGVSPILSDLTAPKDAEKESKSLLGGMDPAATTKTTEPKSAAPDWISNLQLPPLPLFPQGKDKDGQSAYVDPNQIVWIRPMDSSFVSDKKKSGYASSYMPDLGSQGDPSKTGEPGLLDEVGSKAKNKLGLETGKEPRFTIPYGSIMSDSKSVTALVGRIPVQGQIQDPWRFKISTGKTILMANGHELQGIDKAIVEGTAVGDLNMRCVSGKIDVMTFIFHDGRIVTHRARNGDNKADSLGYITDRHANPCIAGDLITNAPQAMAQTGILGTVEGFAKGLADAETQTKTYSDGTTGQVVIGDHLKNAGFNALSGGAADVKQYFADRMGQYFDVIYVPAGQVVDIHVTDEIKLDYDPMGRKVRYESHSNAAHGFMD